MIKSQKDFQFIEDIFPKELEEITRRRKTRNLEAPESCGGPCSEKGLIGLALSGGGIRSATFSLGVIQALTRKGAFKSIDYISTVSGGGYIGSCISSMLNQPGITETDFENRLGREDTPAVKHLRNSSNYLSPGGLLAELRLPAILLRGILLNIIMIVPALILTVFLTEILNECWHEAGANTLSPFSIVIPFIIITYLFAFIQRTFSKRFDWNKRNRYELYLSKLFALTIFIFCSIPALWLVELCVDGWWSDNIKNFFQVTSFEGGLSKTLIVIAGLVIFFLIIDKLQTATKITGIILRYAIGILGPLIILTIYLIFCIFFIESPYIDKSVANSLDKLAGNTGNVQPIQEDVTKLRNLLKGKGYKIPDNSTISVQYSKERNQERRAWEITYKAGAKTVLIQSQEKYLYIPELSIFAAFGTPNTSFMQKVFDLRTRIQWQFYGIGILIFIINIAVLDVNITSPHSFYRDRLSQAYLFQKTNDCAIQPNDAQKMSELNQENTAAPYHLINTTLNLPDSDDPDLRGRKADFFTISKWYTGSEHTGYCPTEKIELLDTHFNLGTAMAISAAAAAPNMGAITMKQFIFIMTLLNVRLGRWTPNPQKINKTKKLRRWTWPNVGPRYLLKEALGDLNDKNHVNLSDGGHLENLGIYQLLKRKCKLIIAVDGEADPNMEFNGLVTLIRYAEIDMGISVEIDLENIRKNDKSLSQTHWALGTIKYGTGHNGEEQTGHLLYIKSSLTGDENEYLKAYWKQNKTFPHQTTADQFFDETQFECYRALGEHIANRALDDEKVGKVVPMPAR